MNIDRRQFVQGALAASCSLAAPVLAEDAAPVYIGDMHSHLFFFGMGRSPEKSPLGPAMAAGNATLVAWSLVGDVPWLRITGKGIKQKGCPSRARRASGSRATSPASRSTSPSRTSSWR